ncbi:hypothetical protein LJR225_002698 [Phenylobacterium sp. LjRoot225]|uniref:hypothetical protein n=1 Tax=Phenylobacterium sp. LjRoot225 TaxID=3342285 RepID=UPI003ECFF441
MRRHLLCSGFAALLSFGPASAIAAETSQPAKHAEPVQQILNCRGLTDSAARLACYDVAVEKMGAAETRGDIVVIDRAQARAAHEQAFGLSLPSLDFITRGLAPTDANRIEGFVRSARADAFGKWTIELSDGAVWRQISDETLSRDPRPGTKVTIRRASMGSYMMNVDKQAAIRVHRDQ